MLKIEPYEESDLTSLRNFVAAIQEHERQTVAALKSGNEISSSYADLILQNVGLNNGTILFARSNEEAIGFICAWVTKDEDPLLRDDQRKHAYISDIYVKEAWRGKNVAPALLTEVERVMLGRGCRRMRICSKATNVQACRFYQSSGFIPYEIVFTKALQAD